jgi:hypothetical protein
MKTETPTTHIEEAKGVQVGDHNVQVNHYHQSQAPNSKALEPKQIPLEIAAAYYNRSKLFPRIDVALSRNNVSPMFIIGAKEDWHDGFCKRLNCEIELHQNYGNFYIAIDWPSEEDSVLKEYTCWHQTLKALGENSPGLNTEAIQQQIILMLTAKINRCENAKILVSYDIDDHRWNSADADLIEQFHQQWLAIHQALDAKVKSNKKLQIGLLFSIVREVSGLDQVKDKILSWLPGERKTPASCPITKQLQSRFDDGLFHNLSLVGSEDADAWLKILQARFPDGFDDDRWWIKLKTQMKKQFNQKSTKIPHKTLKDQLEEDESFVDSLTYKVKD